MMKFMNEIEKTFQAVPIGEESSWEKLLGAVTKYKPEQFPKVSIIIPTSNAAPLISGTLESVISQHYPSYEIIVVDCSTDRTVEIIQSFHNPNIHIFSVSQNQRYEMLNKGLSHATGKYVSFLFPGDYYIYRETLTVMMDLALENKNPELAYCGALIRDATNEVKILFRELNLELLKRGQQPTSLQSCWFRLDCLRELGKFNSHYQMRGGLDLICRFLLERKYRFASVNRVLIDYDMRSVTRSMIFTHFLETMKVVYHYFGLRITLKWLIHQHDTRRFFKLWFHSLKVAFAGK